MEKPSFFPRFLSGFLELTDACLLSPLVSGSVRPFGEKVDIGSEENPFREVHGKTMVNEHGELLVNQIKTDLPLTEKSEEGVSTIGFKYDESLRVTDAGLSVVPLTNDDLNLRAEAPIKMEYDDVIGARILLQTDGDDFSISDQGLLKTKDISLKGLGAIFTGGLTDTDFLDEIIEDKLPKLRLIKMNTSGDFSQAGSLLSVKPKGLPGALVQYGATGLDADSLLYYSGQTLHSPFIDINPSFSPAWQNAVSLAFVQQLYQALPGNAIDIGLYSNGRKYVSVKTDNLTLTQTELGIKGNYIGEAPDITVTGNAIICNITAGANLVKAGSVISLSPDVASRLGRAESDLLSHQ
ncbi:MAG: hypothetical protein EOP84_28900, partial [Verrucomicrobiaceae bacterium]